VQFHVLSFEGRDPYSRVGGLATRVDGLTDALSDLGFDTHLWFVGAPDRPGHESRGKLHLHRWCQWISRQHPRDVYDGEDGKAADYAASLPPELFRQHLMPYLVHGGHAVIMAEEWQTVHAVLHLDWLLREANLRHQVSIFWNANNVFGFDLIDWERLRRAATVTAVSRYMKHCLENIGVESVVIPNGLSADAYVPADRVGYKRFRAAFRDRIVLAKMARWDPDKRWLATVELTAELKRQGWRPLLIARGGNEAYGDQVMRAAQVAGLRVQERHLPAPGHEGLLDALVGVDDIDVLSIRSAVDPDARRVLFRGADAVLANSSREPFGLVGLETMAVGGIACTGCSGEDYAISGLNALVLQTAEPGEFIGLYRQLREDPDRLRAMRTAGRVTARQYAWPEVIRRNLLPRLDLDRYPREPAVIGAVAPAVATVSRRQRRARETAARPRAVSVSPAESAAVRAARSDSA
jgi:glycosyltransferase involved in cell wall biosynthesis